jgi:hypothetical protein
MSRLRPLSSYPAAALHDLSSAIAAVLRYQDMQPELTTQHPSRRKAP